MVIGGLLEMGTMFFSSDDHAKNASRDEPLTTDIEYLLPESFCHYS